ncbi:SDR family oxidoreductase [Caldisericum exile]|uniref:NAD-dependent epimerase/dehydratase family protein n=1 Tax=Caldisericum exile (strain DSM 21853 / NBRC 104410 / AZM16c01) TaxID=511051 RepID=A0A7U6GDA3_CALEA|nr:SDR family oxidoreductase [Caldisericum exile]BAL80221.1 NAD-dependent epimerase/dehydratase family protein [Caldisericum exile AZM16c01]
MIGVIGGTGHLGNVLIRELLKRGEHVVCIVPKGEDLTPISGLAVEVRTGDITDFESINKALFGVDYVYHTAGVISISKGEWEKLYKVNVLGTRNVVEACIKNNVKRLVYTSSIHAFKEPPLDLPITEDIPLEPQFGEYARSKALATLEVLRGVERGLDAVIVAPTGIIGPYDFKVSEMGTLILKYMNSKLFFYVDGAYDFVDVRDVAMGEILAMKKGKIGQIYILSGEKITVKEILEILRNISGKRISHIKISYSLAKFSALFTPIISQITKEKPLFTLYSLSVLKSNCNVLKDKAIKELGYTSRPLETSLKDAYLWFKENYRGGTHFKKLSPNVSQ